MQSQPQWTMTNECKMYTVLWIRDVTTVSLSNFSSVGTTMGSEVFSFVL